MSRHCGPALPAELLARLSQSDLPSLLGRGLTLVTVDPAGRPHPMLVSYLELLALDATLVRVVIGPESQSARNLRERAAATLLIVEPESVHYVKCRSLGAPVIAGTLARFELRVEEVLEDSPTADEGPLRITSGIAYAPAPALDDPRVQGILQALRVQVAG